MRPAPRLARRASANSMPFSAAPSRTLRYTVDDLIAEGDKVVVRWTWSCTHTGVFRGLAPTGRQATVTGMAIVWAVATSAWVGPASPLQPAIKAPKAQSARMTDWAAMRKASRRHGADASSCGSAAPSHRSGHLLGASPSQAPTCLSAGPLLMAVPIAASMVCARASLMPCTATRSTPVMRRMCARVLTCGACLLCARGL